MYENGGTAEGGPDVVSVLQLVGSFVDVELVLFERNDDSWFGLSVVPVGSGKNRPAEGLGESESLLCEVLFSDGSLAVYPWGYLG